MLFKIQAQQLNEDTLDSCKIRVNCPKNGHLPIWHDCVTDNKSGGAWQKNHALISDVVFQG